VFSKHKILEIPDLFKLSVVKFMYSFHNGGLPNPLDNYFAEIASVHNSQTGLASLQKHYLPRMKTYLGQLSLSILVRNFGLNIPEILKSSSPYSFENNIKTSCYLARIPVDFRFTYLSHSVALS